MAKHKRLEIQLENFLSSPSGPTFLRSVDLQEPNPERAIGDLKEILKQRKEQRDKVLDFVIKITAASFFLLVGLLSFQSAGRFFIKDNFSLLNGHELEVLSVSIFGQALGVIWLITSSLWNDKHYLDKM